MPPLKFFPGYELESYPCDIAPSLAETYANRLQGYGYEMMGAGKLVGEATVQAILSTMDGNSRVPKDYTAKIIGPFVLMDTIVTGSAIGVWHRP